MNTSSCFSAIWEFDHLSPVDASGYGPAAGGGEPTGTRGVCESRYRRDASSVRRRRRWWG